MYGYYNNVNLEITEILEKVTEIEIFSIVIKEKINDIGAKYLAPYRLDKTPSCYFKYYNNKLYFYDYTLMFHNNIDCVGIIQKTFNLSYVDALKYIVNYFNLETTQIVTNNVAIKSVDKLNHVFIPYVFNKVSKRIITETQRTPILYIEKEFNNNDKNFWNKYEITKQNLINDKVYSISHYQLLTRSNEYVTIYSNNFMYCYSDFINEGVKIYRPYEKNNKWVTNCTKNDVGGINNLPYNGELLIITKSYKDYRVITNQGYNTIWFQNEGMIPNETIIRDLVNRFQNIIIWFDNDNAGITNGKVICEYIKSFQSNKNNIKLVHLPIELLEIKIKDASDFICKYGKVELNKQINKMFYE